MMTVAEQGAKDFHTGGDRRLTGLFNAVTSGRSVTFALQNLRGKVDGFDDWYDEVRERMRANEVDRWFIELRNRIEKQATLGKTSISGTIHFLRPSQLTRGAPQGTVSTFIGDQLGRSGWNVRLPDGRMETVYFELPKSVGTAALHIADAPQGRPVDELLDEWLQRLARLVTEAEDRFL